MVCGLMVAKSPARDGAGATAVCAGAEWCFASRRRGVNLKEWLNKLIGELYPAFPGSSTLAHGVGRSYGARKIV